MASMRNPIRSETDAFYAAWGGAAVVAAAIALGVLVAPLAGVALIVVAVAALLVWEVRTKNPDRRRPLAEAASHGAATDRHGVLVVANRTLSGDELRAQLADRAAGGAELRVVAPILPSRVHYIATDVDTELRDARERLADVLEWCKAHGLEATGKVGDPIGGFSVVEDELRSFAADEVIISTFAAGRSNWLDTGIVEQLRDELDIPVTHVVADTERATAA
jgi:membrane protein implicated in regulation of membrane protease activity